MLRLLFGFRSDLDLSSRWWHRVAKVGYSMLVLLLLGFLWLIKDTMKPDATFDNVKIIARLNNALAQADKTVPNVISGFLSTPGEVGRFNRTTLSIQWVSEYDLGKSWCTPDAYRHFNATVEHLNERRYGADKVSPSAVLSNIKSVASEDNARLCWMESSLETADNIVKYEFTRKAIVVKWLEVSFYWAVANVILLNLYYRGVVYIICGPRLPSSADPT